MIQIPFGASEFFLGFICNCLSYFITVRITFTCIPLSLQMFQSFQKPLYLSRPLLVFDYRVLSLCVGYRSGGLLSLLWNNFCPLKVIYYLVDVHVAATLDGLSGAGKNERAECPVILGLLEHWHSRNWLQTSNYRPQTTDLKLGSATYVYLLFSFLVFTKCQVMWPFIAKGLLTGLISHTTVYNYNWTM